MIGSLAGRVTLRSSFVVICCAAMSTTASSRSTTVPDKIDWNQIENVKHAAERIARVQRSKGADVAMTLITNCYKTHTLYLQYSRGYEGCLVQDHLQTRVLVEVYSRMQPEALRRIRAPSKENLVRANASRFAATLAKYKVPQTYGRHIRKLADAHGWPLFISIVFPQENNAQETPSRQRPKKRKR